MQFTEEERNGSKVIVIDSKVFKDGYKAKRISKKQRLLIDSGIDMKYLSKIHSSKGKHTFKFTDINSIDDLKMLVDLQRKIELSSYIKELYAQYFEKLKELSTSNSLNNLCGELNRGLRVCDFKVKERVFNLNSNDLNLLCKIKDDDSTIIEVAEELNIDVKHLPDNFMKKLEIFSNYLGNLKITWVIDERTVL